MTEILHSNLENARSGENNPEADNRGLKRKYESKECSDDPIQDESRDENVQGKKELGKLKIAKNVGTIFPCLYACKIKCIVVVVAHGLA